jgi:hypothetical protein
MNRLVEANVSKKRAVFIFRDEVPEKHNRNIYLSEKPNVNTVEDNNNCR